MKNNKGISQIILIIVIVLVIVAFVLVHRGKGLIGTVVYNANEDIIEKAQAEKNILEIKIAIEMEKTEMEENSRKEMNAENIKQTIEQNGHDNVKVKSLGNNEFEVTIDDRIYKVDKDGKVYNLGN